MTYWRQAGVTYLQFSRLAADLVRKGLKADKKPDPGRMLATLKRATKGGGKE